MEKILFTALELEALGFVSTDKYPFEDGGYYETFEFNKGNSKIAITYEWIDPLTFLTGYVEFNDEKLEGREITSKDIELLKELM